MLELRDRTERRKIVHFSPISPTLQGGKEKSVVRETVNCTRGREERKEEVNNKIIREKGGERRKKGNSLLSSSLPSPPSSLATNGTGI